jgi:hypothetical protein
MDLKEFMEYHKVRVSGLKTKMVMVKYDGVCHI